jgi:hypothetical protein
VILEIDLLGPEAGKTVLVIRVSGQESLQILESQGLAQLNSAIDGSGAGPGASPSVFLGRIVGKSL